MMGANAIPYPSPVDITLTAPIEVEGETRDRVTVCMLTSADWRHVRRSSLNKQGRGITICRIATGLSRAAVLQLEQDDIAAVFRAEADLRERFLALDPGPSEV